MEPEVPFFEFVHAEGLEPPRLAAPDPKSGAATNYATRADSYALLKRECKENTFLIQNPIMKNKLSKNYLQDTSSVFGVAALISRQ